MEYMIDYSGKCESKIIIWIPMMDESMIEKKRSRRDQTEKPVVMRKRLWSRFLVRSFPVWSFRFRFVNRIDNHFELTGDFESATGTDLVVL